MSLCQPVAALIAALLVPLPAFGACSASDIAVKSMKARFVNECSRSKCIVMRGVAVLTNRCTEPFGVEMKITGFDKAGAPMATRELWPASVRNIAPGDYTFSLDMWLEYQPGMVSFELSPVRVQQWR